MVRYFDVGHMRLRAQSGQLLHMEMANQKSFTDQIFDMVIAGTVTRESALEMLRASAPRQASDKREFPDAKNELDTPEKRQKLESKDPKPVVKPIAKPKLQQQAVAAPASSLLHFGFSKSTTRTMSDGSKVVFHAAEVKAPVLPYACPHCERRFAKPNAMSSHCRHRHPTKAPAGQVRFREGSDDSDSESEVKLVSAVGSGSGSGSGAGVAANAGAGAGAAPAAEANVKPRRKKAARKGGAKKRKRYTLGVKVQILHDMDKRIAAGETQETVAQDHGISKSTLSEWKKCRVR